MNAVLKMLIAAACIAVIAGVGYFFWDEYREGKRIEAARQERQSEQAQELRDSAERERIVRHRSSTETLKRNHCQQQATNLRVAVERDSEYVGSYREEVRRCLNEGYVSKSLVDGLL